MRKVNLSVPVPTFDRTRSSVSSVTARAKARLHRATAPSSDLVAVEVVPDSDVEVLDLLDLEERLENLRRVRA